MTSGDGKDGTSGLDPNLSAILESIRAAVTGTDPVAASRAEPEAEAAPAAPPPARQARPLRRDLPPSNRTVEEFLADLIRPQVEAWLAAHLPEIVQKLAADEIRRLTGGR